MGMVVIITVYYLPTSVTGKFEGRRDRGRPRLRWTECVERDLCSLGVINWRRKAENRNEWAIIIKEALAKL
ncbi:hypothetical protein C0J52_11641 [Blattella germanica]|nr:hypothetical protein C0J52_11641 [Blattella germanica]